MARVRELWGLNVPQREMLVQLQREGFDVEMKHLVRVRARFGLRLRESVGAFGMRRAYPDEEDEEEEEEEGGGKEDDDEEEEEEGDGENEEGDPSRGGYQAGGQKSGPTPKELAFREERKRAREMDSLEKFNTKKRRRRTKGYAGLPADPPGPPRFPSETTIVEARQILELDLDEYKAFRQKFQAICEASGVSKKTDCGPEKWEAAKDQLIRESMHLRAIMWDQENMDKKRLAIDVIACDVTKRMRGYSKVIGIAQAKTILKLDPQEGREIRASLYRILAEDKFTCKNEEGEERWLELKNKWFESCELMRRVLAMPTTDVERETASRAIDVLARDATRRYRDDSNKGKLSTDVPPKAPKPKPTQKPKAKSVALTETTSTETGAVPEYSFASANPETPNRQRRPQLGSSSTSNITHTQARLLPPDMLDSAEPDMPMDDTLLLSPDPPNPFADSQYYPNPSAAAPVYQHQHQHQHPHVSVPALAPASAPIASTTIGVYFRLDPTSSVFPGTVASSMWISTISSRSINELRSAATEKFPGVLCIAIQGIIKDGKGGELPLPISDDAELDTYLQHVQGVMAPTFNVQLVSAGGREWMS